MALINYDNYSKISKDRLILWSQQAVNDIAKLKETEEKAKRAKEAQEKREREKQEKQARKKVLIDINAGRFSLV